MRSTGGAAFFAMREWEQREAVRPASLLVASSYGKRQITVLKYLNKQAEGKPVNHQLAKEILAGLVRDSLLPSVTYGMSGQQDCIPLATTTCCVQVGGEVDKLCETKCAAPPSQIQEAPAHTNTHCRATCTCCGSSYTRRHMLMLTCIHLAGAWTSSIASAPNATPSSR